MPRAPNAPGAPNAPDRVSAFAPLNPDELRRDKPDAPGALPFEPSSHIATADSLSHPTHLSHLAHLPHPVCALEDVVSRSIPAIVSIEAGPGRGSGFFAAPRTVVTNRHVVQGNVSVTVRLSNGQALPGRVEMSSQEYDLAIVRVDSAMPSQPVLPLGTVNDVRPGQEVIAIGLALGVFQNSVTRGIISAVRRADRTVMLQTDAAINPGNSGGPLLNRRGQVVGINTMKITGAAESLGFAVAVDHARGHVERRKGPLVPSRLLRSPARRSHRRSAARSSTDAAREDGTRRYGQFVEGVARRAAQLDSYWERIKANCAVACRGRIRPRVVRLVGRACRADWRGFVVRIGHPGTQHSHRRSAPGDGPARRRTHAARQCCPASCAKSVAATGWTGQGLTGDRPSSIVDRPSSIGHILCPTMDDGRWTIDDPD